jgi:hypothetical protein
MHRQGKLNNGRTITYASGLNVTNYRGVPEVNHTGSTAGYRAFLARYPKQNLAVALLANVGSVNPGDAGRRVADIFLKIPAETAARKPAKPVPVPAEELKAKAGTYRNAATGEPLRLTYSDGALRIQRGGALVPESGSVFRVGETARRLTFETVPGGNRPRIRELRPEDTAVLFEPVPDFVPGPDVLAAYTGEFYSPDAETTLTAVVEDGRLFLRRRPDNRILLNPVYPDAFESGLGLIRFLRDPAGGIAQISVRQDRVYDLRFERTQKR